MSSILTPLRTPEHYKSVATAAAADHGHAVLAPTHCLVRDGRIIGYTSIMGMPMVHIWMDTKSATARDSVGGLAQIEAVLRDRGVGDYYMPCQETSPFFPLMQKAGFEPIGTCVLFRKKLN